MRFTHSDHGFDPAAVMAARGVVRVRASYLLGRWVQSPVLDRREADT